MPSNSFPKYIFVTGGVISGIGKGVTTASIGLLLKSAGFKISILKVDMYLNIDAGTMNPIEHGEVFVTEDGRETDQDLGNYERFMSVILFKHNYLTMGEVYWNILNKERKLEYKGQTVQGHIHVPEEIIRKIKENAKIDNADIVLVEVGGTVGEYQNIMFFEAIRRLSQQEKDNVCLIHLVYLITPPFLGEMKSKPAQASIYELYKLGLHPDIVIARSDFEVDKKRLDAMAFNTGVNKENIILAPTVDLTYKVPLILKAQKVDEKILEVLDVKRKKNLLSKWNNFIKKAENSKSEVKIAILGKYYTSGGFALEDSYICVREAIRHASWQLGFKPKIVWIDVEKLENTETYEETKELMLTCRGIIVPQGWGSRGVTGKIKAVQIARENKIPYLGLCFGMQMAVIEFARNVVGLKNANSQEADQNTPYPVIYLMESQKENIKSKHYGGTIRLGAYPCKIKTDSLAYSLYKNYQGEIENDIVLERHRHRYEFNNRFKKQLEDKGLVISGTSPDGSLAEMIELKNEQHPFFVATQFHPEYKSWPEKPHPLFLGFIKACSTS